MGYFAANRNIYKDSAVSLKKKKPIIKLSEKVGCKTKYSLGFPGGAVVKNLPASSGDTGLSPGPGRSHMPWSN